MFNFQEMWLVSDSLSIKSCENLFWGFFVFCFFSLTKNVLSMNLFTMW